jgi:biopolymer transport protein ExbD
MAAALAGGGKKNKFDLGQNSDINVTPFVDVMLVLLIIFMVTAPLATVSIKVDLPPPSKNNQNKDKPPPILNIDRAGNLSLILGFATPDARILPIANLDEMGPVLAQNMGASPADARVVIHADQHVHYRQFMDVLNQLQTDGYFKIGLILEEVQND